MTATTTKPYSWLKQISPTLLQKDSIPILGHAPPFPWEQLNGALAKLFQLDGLVIKPAPSFEWRADKDILNGIGDKVIPLNVTVAPTGGNLCWLMAEKDIIYLMSLLLTKQEEPPLSIDPSLELGFYHFLALEVINTLPQLNFDKSLSAQILQNNALPTESSLCLDVSVTIHEKTLWGRLIISSELNQKWKERYAHRTVDAPLADTIELEVSVVAGKTSFTKSEWLQVALGDFLVLDRCTVQPNGEGKVFLAIDDTTVFSGQIKNGKITIVESPLYREVEIGMNTKLPDENHENEEENEEEEFSSLEDENELDEEFEETGEETELEGEETELEGEEGEEEEELGEEDQELQAREHWPPPPEKRPEKEAAAPVQAPPQQVEEKPKEKEKKTVSPEEIPLSVVVEVGRLQMSVQKLMELQPGNLIDLNINPDDGVDLVVNGRRIAKGELLLVGNTLGVRILDIAK